MNKLIFCLVIFFGIIAALKSQSTDPAGCVFQGSLYSDSSEVVLGLPFVLFIRDNDSLGCQLYVQYSTQTGNPYPVKPSTIIRLLDDYNGIIDQGASGLVPFLQNGVNFSVNRDWVEAVYEGSGGRAMLVIRDGRTRFLTDESYAIIRARFIVCPPTYPPSYLIDAENGLYVANDTTVRMGGFLIENTRVQLEGYSLTFIDTTSKQSFGVGAGTLSGYFGDTVGYFGRRSGAFRQFILQGNRYNQIVIRDTSSAFGDYAEFYQGLYFGGKPYMYLDATDREFDGKFSRISIDADSVSFRNSPYLSSVDAYIRYFTAKAGRISMGAIEGELGITGTGVEMGAYGYGVGGGASEYLFMKTKAVDNGTASVGQYLQLISTSTGEVDFATIDLSAYLPIADTAAMLTNYPSTAGYGIIDAGKTWRVDTTSPNGLATRLFAKTLPTSILTGQVAYSNGSNLVGSNNHYWDNPNANLGLGGIPSAQLHLQGNKSAASWTTNGIGLRISSATYTNTTGSGSIALQSAHTFGIPTFASTSATTLASMTNVYIQGPAAQGTNVSFGDRFALYVGGDGVGANNLNTKILGSIWAYKDGRYGSSYYAQMALSGTEYITRLVNSSGAIQNIGVTISQSSPISGSANAIGFNNSLTVSNGNIDISEASGGAINFKAGLLRFYSASATQVATFSLGVASTFSFGTTTPGTSSMFSVRGTTLSSSPFPFHNTVQSNAIAGAAGNFEWLTDGLGPGFSWHNGTRKAYGVESTIITGISTYIPFFNGNGQLAQSADFRVDLGTSTLRLGTAYGFVINNLNGEYMRVGIGTSARGFSVGWATTNSFASIALGRGAATTADNQLVIGGEINGNGLRLDDVFFNGVAISGTGTGRNLRIGNGAAGGTNQSGGNITLNSGAGTGIGTTSDLIFGTPTLAASGATVQSLTNRWWIKGNTGFLGNNSNPAQDLDVTDFLSRDTIFNTSPATHITQDGLAVWKNTAQGYALGKATFGSGLSYSGGVLSATGSADGNGIYSGSGTLANHTTRALIPETGNLYFSQLFNSSADSAFFYYQNAGGGERYVGFGITDTASTGGASLIFGNGGAGDLSFELKTTDALSGTVRVRGLDGDLLLSSSNGNISLSTDVAAEVQVVGLVRAKQEAYYEITSTSSPQTFSNVYSDNYVNQGSTQASFTFDFPPSPEDGQILMITWGNAISTVTLNGNGNTITGTAVTTATAGTRRMFKFYGSSNEWVKIF